MTIEDEPQHPDENGIEALLRQVGTRDEPSPEVKDSVRAAVYAEWQAMLGERRKHRHRRVGWAIAASVAVVAVLAGLVTLRQFSTPAVQVATIARIDGRLLTAGSRDPSSNPNSNQWVASGTHAPVMVGAWLRTDAQSRAALSFDQKVSVRLDRDTTVRALAPDRIELTSGALYVDAPPHVASGSSLIIETRAGAVRHIGTQYEVRAHSDVVQVSVREGRVTFGDMAGEAGERISISAVGQVTRTALSPTDPAWNWALEARPHFDINDRSLASFLAWVARETGRHIVYASPQAQAESDSVKLKGSIADLDLDTALTAVLSTTELTQYDTGDDTVIGIALAEGRIAPH